MIHEWNGDSPLSKPVSFIPLHPKTQATPRTLIHGTKIKSDHPRRNVLGISELLGTGIHQNTYGDGPKSSLVNTRIVGIAG